MYCIFAALSDQVSLGERNYVFHCIEADSVSLQWGDFRYLFCFKFMLILVSL